MSSERRDGVPVEFHDGVFDQKSRIYDFPVNRSGDRFRIPIAGGVAVSTCVYAFVGGVVFCLVLPHLPVVGWLFALVPGWLRAVVGGGLGVWAGVSGFGGLPAHQIASCWISFLFQTRLTVGFSRCQPAGRVFDVLAGVCCLPDGSHPTFRSLSVTGPARVVRRRACAISTFTDGDREYRELTNQADRGFCPQKLISVPAGRTVFFKPANEGA